MRRIALAACLAIALATVAGTAHAGSNPDPSALPRAIPPAPPSKGWAAREIRGVVSAGLMSPSVSAFRPDDPITRGELAALAAALGGKPVTPVDPDHFATMRDLDAQLVGAVGLTGAARRVRELATQAGLRPRPWLGTETVARMLGLRVNHPEAQEELERQLTDPAPRAEAAYSAAQLLARKGWAVTSVASAVEKLELPRMSHWQAVVLERALRFVGSPYVWAGTSENPQQPLGLPVPGGFDCSGFVWRVFKLESFAGAPSLAGILRGRTTYAMSGEVKRSARIPRAKLQTGDIVFFGPQGPTSKPADVGHMGIYVGNSWFVHSSSHGVALEPMTGWWDTTFAWGRSPLTEAGLK